MFDDEEEVAVVEEDEQRLMEEDAERAFDDGEELVVKRKARTGNKQQMMSAEPSMDSIVNLEQRHSYCIYIPCSVADPKVVWHRVVEAIRKMDQADFNEVAESGDEPTYDIYSLKYMYDSFVLARTRLVRLEDEGDGEQIFIELRKLEGDGFHFTDDFQTYLEGELKEVTETQERPKLQNKDEALYLDLSDEVNREEITTYWFKTLRPVSNGTNLAYNEAETYEAMSGLGWNLTNKENFDILVENHKDDIVQFSLNILHATKHLPTAYFSALTLSRFAEAGELDASWKTVKLLCEACVEWSEDTTQKFAGMQISRSREVVRLLANVLMMLGPNCSAEGRDAALPTVEAFVSKLSELQSESEDYAGLDVAALTEALSLGAPEN